jgi:ABC-2 type transport system ATP-binding protein
MASIVVRNATVDIPIFDNTSRSLKKAALGYSIGGALGRTENKAVIVRALSNVSLDLKNGDRVGLIGHNGAGKSTLLRVLAGIYEPTEGTVKIAGKVAAMFDIGLGMNGDATGFDNIRMGGLYLGMSLKEIDAKLPDIAAFSELNDFLNLPVRTYSQGMRTRLDLFTRDKRRSGDSDHRRGHFRWRCRIHAESPGTVAGPCETLEYSGPCKSLARSGHGAV